MTIPKTNAIAIERNMPRITDRALSVLIICANVRAPSVWIFLIMARATVPPSSSNTSDTVVDVGRPLELNASRSITSVTITASIIVISSAKLKYWGWNIPWRAMSIIPLDKEAPRKTPMEAMMMRLRNLAVLEPTAELRKLTASLLTPTMMSEMARQKRKTMIPIYKNSITCENFSCKSMAAMLQKYYRIVTRI